RLSRPPNHLSAPFFSSSLPRPPRPPLFPYTTLFRSGRRAVAAGPATTEETTMTRFIRLGWVAIVAAWLAACGGSSGPERGSLVRSEEHTSELQSRENLVCRLLLEKKKEKQKANTTDL